MRSGNGNGNGMWRGVCHLKMEGATVITPSQIKGHLGRLYSISLPPPDAVLDHLETAPTPGPSRACADTVAAV